MDDVTVSVDTRELDALLASLPAKVARKSLKKALQAGGDVILGAMVTLCPEREDTPTPDSNALPPGVMRADLQTDVRVGNSGGSVRVGPGEVAGHVARWVNNGHALVKGGRHWADWKRGREGSGKVIKHIDGKFFVQGAYDEAGETALDVFIETLAAELAGASGEDSGEGTR